MMKYLCLRLLDLPAMFGWRLERRRNRQLVKAIRKERMERAKDSQRDQNEIERLQLEVDGLALLNAHLRTWTEASTATADKLATVMGRVLPEQDQERLEKKRRAM